MKLFRRRTKLEKFYHKNKRVINYAFASIFCTILLFMIFYIVEFVTNGNYILANLIAYPVSFTLLYILDQEIFKAKPHRRKERISQLYRYTVFRIIGLIIDTFILLLLVEIFIIPSIIAKLFSSLMVFTYNYYANKLFVFVDKHSAI